MLRLITRMLCAALLFTVLSSAADAGQRQQAPEVKRIGIVYIEQVFKNYKYFTDADARLKATFQPEQARFEAEVARVQEMERNLQNDSAMPPGSPQWRMKMMEIETAKLQVQTMQGDFGSRVRKEETAIWLNMYDAFQRACKLLGDYYEYDIIMTAPDPALSEGALQAEDPMAVQQEFLMRRIQYSSTRANLTPTIIELLNARYAQYLQDPQRNTL